MSENQKDARLSVKERDAHKLKKIRGRLNVLNCRLCNEAEDFVIIENGDVECGHCGDVKGNIASVGNNYHQMIDAINGVIEMLMEVGGCDNKIVELQKVVLDAERMAKS